MTVLWALGVTWIVSAIFFLLTNVVFKSDTGEDWWVKVFYGLLWPVFVVLQLALFCLDVLTDFLEGLLQLWGIEQVNEEDEQ